MYVEEGVVHYCVSNMPGAVPQTSTAALTAATLPYVLKLANMGTRAALLSDAALAKGVLVSEGHVTYAALAESLGMPFVPIGAGASGLIARRRIECRERGRALRAIGG